MSSELGAMLPALLDAIGYLGMGVMTAVDRGDDLERWYTSPSMAALLGYSLDELQAIPALETFGHEQRSLLTQLLMRVRAESSAPPAGARESSLLKFPAIRKDGTPVSIELALGHVPIPDGTAYVMVVRSVSAQPLHEPDPFGLVSALSAGFAHEINNPLTSVLLNLMLLRRYLAAGLPLPAQPPAMRHLDDITTSAERIANNVRALQMFVTPSSTTAIDLATVVSGALRIAAPTIEPRANVIRQIFPVRRITGEEGRLRQAVLSMLLFSSSGFNTELSNTSNRIIVCVEERDGDVVLEVSDNGSALTPEEALHAFEPSHVSGRSAGGGIELGIARSAAVVLGGDVTLASRPGGGAVITMRLPAPSV
jgi:nitrogen-specific signal transduction histidine kinase